MVKEYPPKMRLSRKLRNDQALEFQRCSHMDGLVQRRMATPRQYSTHYFWKTFKLGLNLLKKNQKPKTKTKKKNPHCFKDFHRFRMLEQGWPVSGPFKSSMSNFDGNLLIFYIYVTSLINNYRRKSCAS